MRRNHSRSDSYEVEADRQGDTDHVLWRPHAEALAGVLSALAGSSSLDDRRLESIRERSIDPSVEVLVDLLEAASRASSE